ncbi:MAG TPA: hypothetical protein V6D10_06980 [Trichocoleus sp.]
MLPILPAFYKNLYHLKRGFGLLLKTGEERNETATSGFMRGYVHVGESHRGYLGTGTIDFATLFDALAEINYQGTIRSPLKASHQRLLPPIFPQR